MNEALLLELDELQQEQVVCPIIEEVVELVEEDEEEVEIVEVL